VLNLSPSLASPVVQSGDAALLMANALQSANFKNSQISSIAFDVKAAFALTGLHQDGLRLSVMACAEAFNEEGWRGSGYWRTVTDHTAPQRLPALAVHNDSTSRLQKIASRVPGVVYQYRLHPDGSSCFPYASDAIRDVYRVSPEEVCEDASAVLNILHPDDYAEVISSIQKSAYDLTPWQHEYRVRFADGEVRWLFGNALPERESDGATLWHGFITDITERKATEKALRKGERRIRATLDAIPDLMFELDLEGRYLDFHSPRTELLVAPAEDLIGKLISDVLPFEAAHIVMAAMQEAHELGFSSGKQFALKLPQGELWFELSISRKATDPGELPRFIVLSRDITERLRANEQLRISDRALRLISACNLAVVQARDENHLLQELCRLVVDIGGYQLAWVGVAEQDAAKAVRPLLSYGHAKEMLDSIEISWDVEQASGHGPTGTAIRTGVPQVSQNFWTNPKMAPWIAQAINCGLQAGVALPLLANGVALGVLVIYSAEPETFGPYELKLLEGLADDMSFGLMSLRARAQLGVHQQQLEALVSQRTEEIYSLNTALTNKVRDAESASLVKGAFLASMSHELRTPLNAVVGLTGLLIDLPLGRRQRDFVDKIQLSAQTLRTLIDDILDFSKIEAGELRLEQVPFSLNSMLQTVASVVGVGLGNKPVEAVFEVGADVPDALIGDALRLQQILLNLTNNAVKFTSTGAIVVAVRCLTAPACEGAPVTLQFSVRDTGIGIAPEQLRSIFNGFTQADASTSRLYGGSGLGLAISERLATLMGGQIEVESVLGWGTEFCFEVPLTQGHQVELRAAAHIPRNLRILIADDHAVVRDMLTQTCVARGWQATAVDCAAAALNELLCSNAANADYDLLLLDWRMPSLDGLAMLRQAYAMPGLGLPQVLLMASMVELEQAALASDGLHLDGIVAKPLTPGSLQEALIRLFAGEPASLLPVLKNNDKRLAGMRLLVAEDNALNQEVIEHMLTRAGAEVVLVDNGVAAVATLRLDSEPFDAVLMDIQMPVMDGYTATRIIREELGLRELPIIAVTAFAQPQDREKSRLAGMVGHVTKPLNVNDLLCLLVPEPLGLVAHSPSMPCFAKPATSAATPLAVLDVTAAMTSFGGDTKRYADILRKFMRQHGGDAVEASRLFTMDDTPGALHLLHELKGVASFLQAQELAQLASAGEEAMHSGQTQSMPSLFESLQAAMLRLQEAIQSLDTSDVDV